MAKLLSGPRSQEGRGRRLGPCWLVSRALVMGGSGCTREENRRIGYNWESRVSGTPTLAHPQAREVPGVKVFRSSATMYFANAELYSDALKQRVSPGVPRVSLRRSLVSPKCPHPLPLHLLLVWYRR